VFVTVIFPCARRRRCRETRTRRRRGGTKGPSRCSMASRCVFVISKLKKI